MTRRTLYYFRAVKKVILGVIMLAASITLHAQKNISDTTVQFFALSGQLGLHTPMGDLAQRFGSGGLTGASFLYKSPSNWTLEANFSFLFGNQVKEDSILDPIKTKDGDIIGRTGNPVDVFLFERGFVTTARVGKIFSGLGPNPNCGIHVALGGGVMQHKIRIQEDLENVPQLDGPYKKGYDRLTSGLCLSQSIGYQYFSNYRWVNFYVGAEFYEGFTQNRRSLNFDTRQRDNAQRLDILGTLVLRWYFPMYKRAPSDYYFY